MVIQTQYGAMMNCRSGNLSAPAWWGSQQRGHDLDFETEGGGDLLIVKAS
jgi:hypothetical protein